MGLLTEVRVALRVVAAVLLPPQVCPRCHGRKLDAFPPASAGAVFLDVFGGRVISCHTCQQSFVTWRSRRSSERD